MIAVIGVCCHGRQASLAELTLDQAIEQALHGNYSYKKSKLETNRAARDLAANQTKRFASMQLYGLGSQLLTRPSFNFAAGAFGNFAATGPVPATDTNITIPRKPTGVIVATVSQPLTTQYKIHLQLKGLALNVDSMREEERNQRLSTVDQVRRQYYDVSNAQSEFESAQASLPFYRESKRLAGERMKQEAVLESDLLNADMQLVKAENTSSDDADKLAQSMEKLNDTMGRDIHTQFRVSSVLEVDAAGESVDALEVHALQNRPDVKKANLQVRQAEYDSRAKKAEYIPDISLSFNYLTTSNLGNLPTNITSAGLLLNWEPWDWGRRRQELAGKRIQEEEAKVAVDSTVRSALMEVRNAWRKLESSRRTLVLSEVNQRAARQKLRETQEKANVEQVLRKDLFSAQSDLASADSQYHQAVASFWSARADLKKATGEQ